MTHNCDDCRNRNLTSLCLLEASEWASFVKGRTLHQFRAREVVFHEGMPTSTVYILCGGRVKLSLNTPRGTTRIVKLLSARSSPCEILDRAALERPVHSFTCETLTEAQIACIDRTHFIWLLQHNHRFTLLVLNALIAEAMSHLDALREQCRPARQRLGRVLIALSENSEKEQGGWTHSHAPLSLRRQEIADLLGITRETVARILNSFQREGLIALHGRRCEILALDRLRRLVGATAPSVTKITSRV